MCLKLNLKQLQKIVEDGNEIEFEYCTHPRITITVLKNNKVIGDVTKGTYKAYFKWKSNINNQNI